MTDRTEKQMESTREQVDLFLRRALSAEGEDPAEIYEGARYAVFSGGKRIRPVLLVHACETCGGDPEKALPAAAAIELIHAFSLVQDDLPAMDDDDTRRGKPTLHRRYDEATALLVSDFLLLRALELVATGYPPALFSLVAEAIGPRGLLGGQLADLAWQGRPTPPGIADDIRFRKTAALFELSFRLGAEIAGADPSRCAEFASCGRLFGLAFQYWDDINDTDPGPARDALREKLSGIIARLRLPGPATESRLFHHFLDFLAGAARD